MRSPISWRCHSALSTRFWPRQARLSRTSATVAHNGTKFDTTTDVLVVGGGAAGLTAALRASSHGHKPLVIEKNEQVGGSSAYSGAGLWIPLNSYVRAQGVEDSKENALKYMESVIRDVGPASSRERKLAFLEKGPEMIDFLRELGFKWRCSKGVPDYYPTAPGGMSQWGRTVEPDVFDLKKLGDWSGYLRARPRQPPPLFTDEVSSLTRAGSSFRDFAKGVQVVLRGMRLKMQGQAPTTMGQSLISQLLYFAKQAEVPVWRSTSLVELISAPDGSILGAKVRQGDDIRSVRANRGVLLCAGGFAHNQKMRDQFGPSPASTRWTSTPEGDTGDAIQAAVEVGASTALMDEAWWGPSILDPNLGKYYFSLQERARPYSIIVDSTGSRFMNEAESYIDAGHKQYARNQKVKAIPAWLIVDENHRRRYALGSLMPRQDPKRGLEAGYIHKADTLEELAQKIGIDVTGLMDTIRKFNAMAADGVDTDFGRGNNTYDNYFGDPKVGPNPNLGPIAKPPFYAVEVVPGDLGTKGGLLTDEHARVLKEDGSTIPGLYACGNTSASVMGRTYPGAGSTLGPALTFAYIAADSMATGIRA
ncbi:FAD binding domain-containing protein [Poronia punctata]|nr:FAD binding domain-containing protein [Poronia punctata]